MPLKWMLYDMGVATLPQRVHDRASPVRQSHMARSLLAPCIARLRAAGCAGSCLLPSRLFDASSREARALESLRRVRFVLRAVDGTWWDGEPGRRASCTAALL